MQTQNILEKIKNALSIDEVDTYLATSSLFKRVSKGTVSKYHKFAKIRKDFLKNKNK